MTEAAQKSGSAGKNIAIAVLALLVLGLALMLTLNPPGGSSASEPAPAQQTTAAESVQQEQPAMDPETEEFLLSLAYRLEDDPMAKGAVDAPVAIVEWADFQCGYCNQWAIETMPQLQPLVDDGTLRIEYRDMALFGDASVAAAAAARAAGEQGLFWEYHDALHAVLHTRENVSVSNDLLAVVAQSVGVADLERFEADRTAQPIWQAVSEQTEMARQMGITSTPTFLVGTELIQGAQPVEAFHAAIERQMGTTR